jgi:hypothetical protein
MLLALSGDEETNKTNFGATILRGRWVRTNCSARRYNRERGLSQPCWALEGRRLDLRMCYCGLLKEGIHKLDYYGNAHH